MKVGKANHAKTTMPFGKHKGEEVTDLPDQYLEWLSEQEWFEEKYGFLYKLVNDERTTREEQGEYFPDGYPEGFDPYDECDSIYDHLDPFGD